MTRDMSGAWVFTIHLYITSAATTEFASTLLYKIPLPYFSQTQHDIFPQKN